jgi:OOP family OmpA-OmpF porin
MKFSFLFLVMLLFLVYPLTAFGAGGFYLGGSVGRSSMETELSAVGTEDLTLDENNISYKAFGGIHLNNFLSAEGGYRSMGEAETEVLGYSLSSSTKGWDVTALGRAGLLGLVHVFAKAGMFFWTTESALDSQGDETTGSDFMWGVGATITLGSLGVRLEWEKLEVGDLNNLSMISAGVTFGF